jgi:hypothetical protein
LYLCWKAAQQYVRQQSLHTRAPYLFAFSRPSSKDDVLSLTIKSILKAGLPLDINDEPFVYSIPAGRSVAEGPNSKIIPLGRKTH